MNLNTKYLGFELPHPLMVGPGPLTDELDTVRQLEDAGASALALRSLYEEEIKGEQMAVFCNTETHNESFAEATTYYPEQELAFGPEEYLEHLRKIKDAVRIPVIGSLNGTSIGGWTSYASLIEQAGADALELNIYHAASDPSLSGADVERQMIDIVREVKRTVKIPVAVKLSPLLTAFANFALQVDNAGADGLILFTRFPQADIDVIELEVVRKLELSDSSELRLRLRGAAVLSGHIKASLAITGGVHTALDVIKSNMAGAHVTQLVSTLLQNGPRHIQTLLSGIKAWMEENEWNSLNEMRGNMSFQHVPNPAAYEREMFRSLFALRNYHG